MKRLTLVLVGLSALLLIAGNPARATSFDPTLIASVSNSTPGANADVSTRLDIFAPDSLLESLVLFTPPDFWVAADADVPVGAVVGQLTHELSWGLLSESCNIPVSTEFSMMDCTTDTSNTVPFGGGFMGDNGPNFWGGFGDANGNNLADACDKYPDFLNTLFPGIIPRARYYGQTLVANKPTSMNDLTFEAGTSLPGLPTFPSSLGYASISIFSMATDPTAEPEPSALSDTCTPSSLATTIFGQSVDNPDTLADEGGYVVRTNPSSTGDYYFRAFARSLRDADDDGIENDLDTCPYTPDPTWNPRGNSTYAECVAGSNPGDQDCDMLPSSCDPDDAVVDVDQDVDGYSNAQDNCPQVQNGCKGPYCNVPFNPTWDNQADADGDGIGDACDLAPSSPSGHNHERTLLAPVAISAGPAPDTDGDDIPDAEDACPNEPEDFDQDEDGCPGISFAIITDLHLGISNDLQYEDYDYYPIRRLQRAVQWINDQPQIKLVFVLGDLSDEGDKDVLERAREELQELDVPFVPLIGNHDVNGNMAHAGDGNFTEVFPDQLAWVKEQLSGVEITPSPGCDESPGGIFEWDAHLQNFTFAYRGVRFIGLDFVERRRTSEATAHDETRKCLRSALSSDEQTVVILAHHPILTPAEVKDEYREQIITEGGGQCSPVVVDRQSLYNVMTFDGKHFDGLKQDISSNKGDRQVFSFGGHLHSNPTVGLGALECPLKVFDGNVEIPGATIGVPVVITEALKSGSKNDGDGFIRIVNVKGSNVDLGQIEGGLEGGFMPALNPDFHWSRPAPCPAGMASLVCGLQRAFTRSPVTFQADTYTNRDIDCYMWDFGNGTCNADCGARQEQTYAKGGVYNVCLTVFGKDVATPRLPDEPEGERIQETICRSVTVK